MGPTIKYLFFWKVSSNKLDRFRGVEECFPFHREPHLTSRSAAAETTALKLQLRQGKVKLIYDVPEAYDPKIIIIIVLGGWIQNLGKI